MSCLGRLNWFTLMLVGLFIDLAVRIEDAFPLLFLAMGLAVLFLLQRYVFLAVLTAVRDATGKSGS